ncbi:MAG TPA: NUDIX hydrolase [Candidatus Dormibacteraeota bacterium]|nr:NUDIX hydrolase [Candidatus Dormibacteraeota bacterium]
MTDAEPQVRAAGGVLWRRGPGGTREWAVIHRPRYDDWSLPKGKLEEGESLEAAALREVLEETGMQGRLGSHVGTNRYLDNKGRTKTADYFLIEAVDGGFSSNAEVDELRWLDAAAAVALLSHEHDRLLLARVTGSDTPAA